MLVLDKTMLKPEPVTETNPSILQKAVWIDLLNPSREEELLVEQALSMNIPTRAEMVEIEVSSRLYTEKNNLFMTATMIAQADSPEPKLDPVTFIITKNQLITIRYIEPMAFNLVNKQLRRLDNSHRDHINLLIEILDATVDRLADILELIGHRLDDYSKALFQQQESSEKLDYKLHMQQIATNGDLQSKATESLITFNRLITFFLQSADSQLTKEKRMRLTTLNSDITSLHDHANLISIKMNFLLDATLGMVNIEQNNIIKILSVGAVIFLPPTLIASIYGMNFHFIPELS